MLGQTHIQGTITVSSVIRALQVLNLKISGFRVLICKSLRVATLAVKCKNRNHMGLDMISAVRLASQPAANHELAGRENPLDYKLHQRWQQDTICLVILTRSSLLSFSFVCLVILWYKVSNPFLTSLPEYSFTHFRSSFLLYFNLKLTSSALTPLSITCSTPSKNV